MKGISGCSAKEGDGNSSDNNSGVDTRKLNDDKIMCNESFEKQFDQEMIHIFHV